MLPAIYRVIVRCDIRNNVQEDIETNNQGVSTGTFSLDTQELQLGVPFLSQLTNENEHYYKVNVPAGEDLHVVLDSGSTNSANELYVRYGAMPSRTEFDLQFPFLFSPDQAITIPATKAGWYYILVRGETSSTAPADYNIRVSALQYSVTSISPNRGGNNGKVTVAIFGARFGTNATVLLKRAGYSDVIAQTVTKINSTKLKARFDLTAADLGGWTLVVSDPQYGETPPQFFHIERGEASRLDLAVIGPDSIRVGGTARYVIAVRNNSNIDAEGVVMHVRVPHSPHSPVARKSAFD